MGVSNTFQQLPPECGFQPVSPFLSPLTGEHVPTWWLLFPSYLLLCRSFLQPWLYKSSCQFQLVFSENWSTCRCIFDVFVEGGEFHVLLLHHLGQFPLNACPYLYLMWKLEECLLLMHLFNGPWGIMIMWPPQGEEKNPGSHRCVFASPLVVRIYF